MAKIHNEPQMEFLNMYVQETTVNTYREIAFQTPSSKTEKMAMLIHKVEFDLDDPEGIDGTTTIVAAHIAKDSQDALIRIDNPQCIDRVDATKLLGVTQGTLTEYNESHLETKHVKDFVPAVLYPKDQIYLAVKGLNNTSVKGGTDRLYA